MTWISYAQNFEDVMLMRCFGQIDRGFYIDVGAQGPEDGSVTKALYDRGWSGINVEPVEEFYDMLVRERPRDINVRRLLGGTIGDREFFEIPHTGLSTTVESVAARHAGHGTNCRLVPQTTFDALCREFHITDVHFLKIDVEGAEEEVLRGCSFRQVRPWIVIVEATKPNSPEASLVWEALILGREYRLAYDDGLNRWYVAREHERFVDSLRLPPNIFDDFVVSELANARNHMRALMETDHAARLEVFRTLEMAGLDNVQAMLAFHRELEQLGHGTSASAEAARRVINQVYAGLNSPRWLFWCFVVSLARRVSRSLSKSEKTRN